MDYERGAVRAGWFGYGHRPRNYCEARETADIVFQRGRRGFESVAFGGDWRAQGGVISALACGELFRGGAGRQRRDVRDARKFGGETLATLRQGTGVAAGAANLLELCSLSYPSHQGKL